MASILSSIVLVTSTAPTPPGSGARVQSSDAERFTKRHRRMPEFLCFWDVSRGCAQEAGPDGGATRLVVGNLTRNVTEDHIKEIFSCYGSLKSVELAMDKAVNLPRGFAHVEFENHEDAERALDYMNNGQIDGNVVRWAATTGHGWARSRRLVASVDCRDHGHSWAFNPCAKELTYPDIIRRLSLRCILTHYENKS
jgi:hypothetical protein